MDQKKLIKSLENKRRIYNKMIVKYYRFLAAVAPNIFNILELLLLSLYQHNKKGAKEH